MIKCAMKSSTQNLPERMHGWESKSSTPPWVGVQVAFAPPRELARLYLQLLFQMELRTGPSQLQRQLLFIHELIN